MQIFLACLRAIKAEGILVDVDEQKLFGNICDILEKHIELWTQYLYPMASIFQKNILLG